MKHINDLTYNELRDAYHRLKSDNENLQEDNDDLENEISYYDNMGIPNQPTLLDELKWNILIKSFNQYSLDELERRLDLDYTEY